MNKRILIGLIGLAALVIGLWLLPSSAPPESVPGRLAVSGASEPAATTRASARPSSGSPSPAVPGPARPAGQFAQARWGSGPAELGRDQPQEGNPEAPMSLALDPAGNAVVLDQVNGRLIRFGPDGAVQGSFPLSLQAAQELTFAADGSAAVLDRLVDKAVALFDPAGKLKGELPVEGKGISEGGAITGLFLDGTGVYVEREHAVLVRIGDTSGQPDLERPELPGRPTRDGLSFISAGMTDPATGRVYVNSIAREGLRHRFTRELRLGVPLVSVLLLDTDRAGVIYLALLAERPTAQQPAPTVLLTCLSPLDGHPLGKVELPANRSAEETFRELTVFDQGGVLYAQRDDTGLTLQRYSCP
jgi:hypothetical protein